MIGRVAAHMRVHSSTGPLRELPPHRSNVNINALPEHSHLPSLLPARQVRTSGPAAGNGFEIILQVCAIGLASFWHRLLVWALYSPLLAWHAPLSWACPPLFRMLHTGMPPSSHWYGRPLNSPNSPGLQLGVQQGVMVQEAGGAGHRNCRCGVHRHLVPARLRLGVAAGEGRGGACRAAGWMVPIHSVGFCGRCPAIWFRPPPTRCRHSGVSRQE